MKPRTNISTAARNTRISNSPLGVALSGLAMALTPVTSVADNGAVTIARQIGIISDRPISTELPPSTARIGADYNHSGMVDIDDLFDYLTGWMAGHLAADTNLNGVLEYQDVLDYVDVWFVGYGRPPEANPL